MPRYFFHCKGAQTFHDEEGMEFGDLGEVRLQAITNAAEILRDHAGDFSLTPHWRVFVTDADERTVFWLEFSGQEPPPDL